jgi:hypothetical protein
MGALSAAADQCVANGGFGVVSWPGALVIVALIAAGCFIGSRVL